MAEWRVYGCGSASSDRSLQTSYEFTDGETRLHIDFGNGAFWRRCQVEGGNDSVLDSIEHLFITHGHADHTIDLTRHMVAWKYTPGYTGKPVNLYSTQDTLDTVQDMLAHAVTPGMYDEVYVSQAVEMGRELQIGNLHVIPFPTTHMQGSCGIRIETKKGLHIAFTSDASEDGEMQNHLHDLDLLIIEASFHHTEHHMHLTLTQAGRIAGEVKPKAILLVHHYPEVEEMSLDEIRTVVREHYEGEIHRARDGMVLKWDGGWKLREMFS